MKTLATITDEDIFPSAKNKDPKDFFIREAARAVVLNNQGQIYLLNMTRDKYHKLPGGGIDEGEDIKTALERELLEEIGCRVKVLSEVGQIIEYRNKIKLQQTSYCYIAQQVGNLESTNLEPSEIEQGAKMAVAQNIDDAIQLLEQDIADHYEGHFIQRRDLLFLQTAKSLLSA